ncbi:MULTISPECIES: glycosyltransferase family 2 protein [unclassified Vibrio]|uniref:Glycosyltransferase n=1 Tax=Vibrio sp. HB236076 TaxID=3232307 RepID=A0AB39HB38_9VIBR|nr:glycosyltransferase [Vibrio sp. HB161653]MDP5254346.1 glycosyltransferase [Vibrio sp. HB161653]
MKRLILHVGFHKTATSSIQKTLAHNRSELEKQGYIYPSFIRHNKDIINHSIPFYSVYCQKPELYHINIKNGDSNNIGEANDNYNKQIDHYLSMDKNIIISGEDISVLPHHALISLRDKILSKGFDLNVYCSVRKPYPFTCSELQERIKSGNGTLDNITVTKKSGFIEKLKQVFGEKVTFSSFEEDIQSKQGVVGAMLTRMGVNCHKLTVQNSNEGFGNQSTRFLAHLNKNSPTILDGKINPVGRGYFTKSLDNEKFHLTGKELEKVKNELNKENGRIQTLLGASYCDSHYPVIKDESYSIERSVQLIKTYTNRHTLFDGIQHILEHSTFSASDLANQLDLTVEEYRNLAQKFKGVNIFHSLTFIAFAKKLRPQGPVIRDLYEEIKQEFLNNINIGIGIITFNRIHDLQKTIKSVKENTSDKVNVFVADDGSTDGTSEWCQENNIPHSQGSNKGVVRNKNRALYYLYEKKKCDIIILLEDDCRPTTPGWVEDWAVASFLWGHINYAHRRIIQRKDALIEGNGEPYDPFICKLVTGQCTGCFSKALSKVGYLDPRFSGYGAGHVEWTERFIKHGYNGSNSTLKVFPAINSGLHSDDAPTFKDEEQLKRNQELKRSMENDQSYRLPWKDEVDMHEFMSEIPGDNSE